MADNHSDDVGEAKPHGEHVERDVAKLVHADGTVNYVDAQAIGGDVDELPKGYFRSPQFIGTVVVSDPLPCARWCGLQSADDSRLRRSMLTRPSRRNASRL